MKAFILFLAVSLLVFDCATDEPQEVDYDQGDYTSEECTALGGRIVNTHNDECSGFEQELGDVTGVKCPCVCCLAE